MEPYKSTLGKIIFLNSKDTEVSVDFEPYKKLGWQDDGVYEAWCKYHNLPCNPETRKLYKKWLGK
jgi:hypothetical protein